MMLHDGIWWPDNDRDARGALLREVQNVSRVMQHVEGRECVIQAGGNVGLYPKKLAGWFSRVVTFEPDPENFACMSRNVDAKNVEMHNAALGQTESTCRMIHAAGNCGAHRVEIDGPIPVVAIDDLEANPDLIWLDIEGFEPFALFGAEKTIRYCRPVIVIEEKGHSRQYGVEPEQTDAFLRDLGYQHLETIGRDKVYG